MEATLSPETYLDMLGDWPAAVGRFVLAFSSCEYWTYVYLQQLGTRSVRAELANSKLSVRVERILKLARERGVAQDLYAEMCSILKRLRSLAPMARSNSPTLGHPKFPQAGPPDYDDSGPTAMRAAASLSR